MEAPQPALSEWITVGSILAGFATVAAALYATRVKLPADQLKALQETLDSLGRDNLRLAGRLDREVEARKALEADLATCKDEMKRQVDDLRAELLRAYARLGQIGREGNA